MPSMKSCWTIVAGGRRWQVTPNAIPPSEPSKPNPPARCSVTPPKL
jgi:hypothetical protein